MILILFFFFFFFFFFFVLFCFVFLDSDISGLLEWSIHISAYSFARVYSRVMNIII